MPRSTQPLSYTPRRALAPWLLAAVAAVSAFGLTGCGGGDDPAAPAAAAASTVQLSGTAATGAAIAGATVTATNATGTTATAVTGADGRFTVNISDGAPYVLNVTDASGKVWYSYAAQAGTANITPLTTLALLDAHGNKPLADLVRGWANTRLSADAVLASAAKVNAHLRTQMTAQGLNPNTYNLFTTAFNANQTGFDAVLDATRVSLDCSAGSCTQRILSPTGGVLVNWNGNIATTGITLSWTATDASGNATGGSGSSGAVTVGLGSCKSPKAGTYSMVVTTTVAGLGAVPIPEICIDGLPGKPANQAEFCGASDVTAQLPPGVSIVSCTFSGNTGTIAARISSPIVLDYSVSYTFVLR